MINTTQSQPKRIQFNDSFNWLALLKDLAAGSPLHVHDHAMLCFMAGAWPQCACGQLCKLLPKDHQGAPKDRSLENLGVLFVQDIVGQRWPQAINIFYQIEARTDFLLEEMTGVKSRE